MLNPNRPRTYIEEDPDKLPPKWVFHGRLWLYHGYYCKETDIIPSVFEVDGVWYSNEDCVRSFEEYLKDRSKLKGKVSFESAEEAMAYCTMLVAMTKYSFRHGRRS